MFSLDLQFIKMNVKFITRKHTQNVWSFSSTIYKGVRTHVRPSDSSMIPMIAACTPATLSLWVLSSAKQHPDKLHECSYP